MFGAGEIVLIVVLAVIFLGPDKLPELARSLGKIYAEYQKAKREIELELLKVSEDSINLNPVNTAREEAIKKIISDDVSENKQKDERV